MFVPIVRSLWLKRMYHAIWGRWLLGGASAVIATSKREGEELVAGSIARSKVVLRRNGVEVTASWPARGTFRKGHGISPEEKVVLCVGRWSAEKSRDLLVRSFA